MLIFYSYVNVHQRATHLESGSILMGETCRLRALGMPAETEIVQIKNIQMLYSIQIRSVQEHIQHHKTIE